MHARRRPPAVSRAVTRSEAKDWKQENMQRPCNFCEGCCSPNWTELGHPRPDRQTRQALADPILARTELRILIENWWQHTLPAVSVQRAWSVFSLLSRLRHSMLGNKSVQTLQDSERSHNTQGDGS